MLRLQGKNIWTAECHVILMSLTASGVQISQASNHDCALGIHTYLGRKRLGAVHGIKSWQVFSRYICKYGTLRGIFWNLCIGEPYSIHTPNIKYAEAMVCTQLVSLSPSYIHPETYRIWNIKSCSKALHSVKWFAFQYHPIILSVKCICSIDALLSILPAGAPAFKSNIIAPLKKQR